MAMMSEGQPGCMAQEILALDKVRVDSSTGHPIHIAMVLGTFVAGRQISWMTFCGLGYPSDMNL